MKYLIVTFLLFTGCFACAQTPAPVGATSATDSEVKIHNSRKLFSFGSGKRTKTQKASSVSQRKGEAIQKKNKPKRHSASRQARVFQRHNHFADQEKSSRTRSRGTKKN